LLPSILDKEREALEADIATLRSSVAHANERIALQAVELGRAVEVLQWGERAGTPSPKLRFERIGDGQGRKIANGVAICGSV
jgi:hypothetical protein